MRPVRWKRNYPVSGERKSRGRYRHRDRGAVLRDRGQSATAVSSEFLRGSNYSREGAGFIEPSALSSPGLDRSYPSLGEFPGSYQPRNGLQSLAMREFFTFRRPKERHLPQYFVNFRVLDAEANGIRQLGHAPVFQGHLSRSDLARRENGHRSPAEAHSVRWEPREGLCGAVPHLCDTAGARSGSCGLPAFVAGIPSARLLPRNHSRYGDHPIRGGQ